MTPELSHRIARALHALPADALAIGQRFDIGAACEPHDRFEDLPAWIRGLVETGEQILSARPR